MAARPLLLNVDDPLKDGLIVDRSTGEKMGRQVVFRNSTEILRILPLTTSVGGPPFQQVDLSNLTGFRVGVGLTDEEPTGGTWALTANGTGTGMAALDDEVSDTTLQGLLNAILGANAVTVVKTGSLWTITVTATNTAVTFDSPSDTLTPASIVSITNPEPAGVGVQAVYQITLKQLVYAYTTDFTVDDPETAHGTISSVDTGTDIVTFSTAVVAGNRYRFTTTGALPTGLAINTDYYALSSGTTSQVSRWPGGAAINLTGAGSGTNSVFNREYGVSLVTTTAGSATSPAVYTITIDPDPLNGAFRFSWQQAQKALVTVQANTAVAAEWYISANGDESLASIAWGGNYLDLPDTSNNPVRFWMQRLLGTITAVNTGTETLTFTYAVTSGNAYRFTSSGTLPAGLSANTTYYALSSALASAFSLTPGGAAENITGAGTGTHYITDSVAPATPSGGALSAVNYTGGDWTETQMLSFLRDAANAYTAGAAFSAQLVDGVLRVTSASGGERDEPATTISAISSIETETEGSTGRLVGNYFVGNDSADTTVCFYITGGTQLSAPADAADYSRAVAINLAGGESASAAATAIAAAAALDASFTGSTASGNVVSLLNTNAGARGTNTDASLGFFSTAISQSGFSIVATVDYLSSASAFESDLAEAFTVTKSDPNGYIWTVTAANVGAITTPTVEDAGLVFPIGVNIELPFSSIALQQKFWGDDVNDFTADFSIKATFGSDPEVVWLQTEVDLTADLLDTGASSGPVYNPALSAISLSITGTAGAGFIDLANQSVEPSAPTGGIRLYSISSCILNILLNNGFHGGLSFANIDADREYDFPNADGTVVLQNYAMGLSNKDLGSGMSQTHSAITYAATTNLDLSGNSMQTVSLTGNVTFTTSNRAACRSKTVRIIGDGSIRTFTFPAWKFIGAAAPASLAASKTAILTITAFGSADTDIVAAYAVEP